MAKRKHLEIDPKPNAFASLFNSGEMKMELGEDWPLADPEIVLPGVNDLLLGASSNVRAIRPNPGICVKTKSDKGEKVFINICHHSDVPLPSPSLNVDDIMNYTGESIFHFPLSIGELRTEKDKSENNCKCFDVVINSVYYQKEILKKRIRDFILNLAISKIKEKYDITIDVEAYRILTKRYHCEMHDHFIRVEPKTNADSKTNMISSMIASGAKYSDLKKKNIVDPSEVTIQEGDVRGLEKMCKLLDSTTTVPITPNPGLCAKTRTRDNQKVFINLCHHNAIPPPPPSMSIEAILKKESPVQFPLSLGELRIEKDKSGNECNCYDVVVNSDYYHDEIVKKEEVRDYFLILACTGLGQNYNLTVDVGALKILSKPYHGEMPNHFLKFVVLPEDDEKMQCDESTSKDEIVMPIKDPSQLIPFSSPKIVDYKLFPKRLEKASLLVFQGSVINVSSKSDVSVFVSKQQVTIEDKKGNIILNVPIPMEYAISPEKSLSNLWNKTLYVGMPIELKKEA